MRNGGEGATISRLMASEQMMAVRAVVDQLTPSPSENDSDSEYYPVGTRTSDHHRTGRGMRSEVGIREKRRFHRFFEHKMIPLLQRRQIDSSGSDGEWETCETIVVAAAQRPPLPAPPPPPAATSSQQAVPRSPGANAPLDDDPSVDGDEHHVNIHIPHFSASSDSD